MLSRYPTKLGSLNEPLMGFNIFFYGGLLEGLYGKKKKKATQVPRFNPKQVVTVCEAHEKANNSTAAASAQKKRKRKEKRNTE